MSDGRNIIPIGMYGAILVGLGLAAYLTVVVSALPWRFLGWDQRLLRDVAWWSGVPTLTGVCALIIDAVTLAPKRKGGAVIRTDPVSRQSITVVLTALNDEDSIGDAVEDFANHPLVERVLVVDNDSDDETAARARRAGGLVHVEHRRGYGHCVFRALDEAAKFDDTEIVALCEGDRTFRAADLDKLLPYVAHGDVTNGTRIIEQLRNPGTQLTTFMYWANFVGAKLLEVKHLGRGTITDLGTTYKLCRTSFLKEHLREFDPSINLEFNAHFLDTVMRSGKLVEAPVTFYPRVGRSKGGNASNRRAVWVGARMVIGMAHNDLDEVHADAADASSARGSGDALAAPTVGERTAGNRKRGRGIRCIHRRIVRTLAAKWLLCHRSVRILL